VDTAKINLESFKVKHDVQILVIPESYEAGGVDVLENFQSPSYESKWRSMYLE